MIEHKHFELGNQTQTIITREFPKQYQKNEVPYYPINTTTNNKLYEKYRKEAEKKKNLVLGGRLATYRYSDMDDIIFSALQFVEKSNV